MIKTDWSSVEGAAILAMKLRRYWAKRGVHIQTRVEELHGHGEVPIYCVRSNINMAVRKSMQ